MKKLILLITIITISSNIFSQNTKEAINEIRQQFKWVNSQKNFKSVSLNNLDFLEHPTDNGATLTGFYKNNILYKVTETIGISYAIYINEYYLKNNKLIFVYAIEKQYKQKIDKNGKTTGELDYTSTDLKYEHRLYYKNEKQIRELKKGTKISGNNTKFLSHFASLKKLLDNKYKYQKEYKLLQGTWISKDDTSNSIEIDGLIKTEYSENEYIDEAKIKIEGKYLFFYTSDGDTYKYEILELSDKTLKLIYLARGNTLVYYKK